MWFLVLILTTHIVVAVTQDQCYCFTGTTVNIRDAPCGNVIGSVNSGQCYTQRSGSQNCVLSGTTYTFVEFQYGSTSGWAANNFLESAAPPDQCYCFTSNGINIRDAPCGSNIIGSANSGQCYTQACGSRSQVCVLSGTTYTFVEFQYGSTSGWAANNFLQAGNCGDQGECSNILEIVDRAGWGARAPKWTTSLSTPVDTVFIHHTVTASCNTGALCEARMRNIQNYHMDTKGWSDIGYNFVIADDGRAYEGRGWNIQGAHTGATCNGKSLAISLIGNFDTSQPSQAMIQLTKNIIDCGIKQGYIASWDTVNILGHRDVCSTACPGSYMYSEIKTWPWYKRTIPCSC